jgi:hypothetical protein
LRRNRSLQIGYLFQQLQHQALEIGVRKAIQMAEWGCPREVASCFPFQTTYYLNGLSSSRNSTVRSFHKPSWLNDVAALQAAADRLSPKITRKPRKRLDYWTLILGPKFSAKAQPVTLLRRQPGRSRELLILLEEGTFEVGAEDMMAVSI